MEQENWKVYYESKLPSTHKNYVLWEVSDKGNVRRNNTMFKLNKLNSGYLCFSNNLVHRAVAELFIPNPENKPCVDHINCNNLDNRVENLRWVTYSENMLNPITRKHNSDSKIGKEPWNKGKNVSNHRLGKKHSEETKQNISESLKGCKHPMYGKHQSEETKQKRINSLKGKYTKELNSVYGKHRVYDNPEHTKWHME